MSVLGRQLRQTARFGRQLSRGANVFGRQLSNTAKDVSKGINQAQRTISKLEQPLGSIPVLGTGLKAVNSSLGAVNNLAKIGDFSGQAIRAGASGDLKGVGENLIKIDGAGKDLLGDATNALTQGAGAVAQGALFV